MHSLPMSTPASFINGASHVAASPVPQGRHAALTPSKNLVPRTPLGPSLRRIDGTLNLGRGVVCQKSLPVEGKVGQLLSMQIGVRNGTTRESTHIPASREIFSVRLAFRTTSSTSNPASSSTDIPRSPIVFALLFGYNEKERRLSDHVFAVTKRSRREAAQPMLKIGAAHHDVTGAYRQQDALPAGQGQPAMPWPEMLLSDSSPQDGTLVVRAPTRRVKFGRRVGARKRTLGLGPKTLNMPIAEDPT